MVKLSEHTVHLGQTIHLGQQSFHWKVHTHTCTLPTECCAWTTTCNGR